VQRGRGGLLTGAPELCAEQRPLEAPVGLCGPPGKDAAGARVFWVPPRLGATPRALEWASALRPAAQVERAVPGAPEWPAPSGAVRYASTRHLPPQQAPGKMSCGNVLRSRPVNPVVACAPSSLPPSPLPETLSSPLVAAALPRLGRGRHPRGRLAAGGPSSDGSALGRFVHVVAGELAERGVLRVATPMEASVPGTKVMRYTC
jgi:hypothetical protein